MSNVPLTSSRRLMSLMTTLFFIWGFMTILNDLLVPHLKALFELNYAEAMLIQFCFFFTYFVMSPVMAHLLTRVGYRLGMVIGLLIIAVGALLFLPASSLKVYPLFLFALFVLASGIVLLQVSANPSVTSLGDTRTAASRLTLAQALNSLGTTVAPLIVGGLIIAGSIAFPYMVIAGVMVLMALIFYFTRFNAIERPVNHVEVANHVGVNLWKKPEITLGVFAIFMYVGAEVSAGSLLVNYLHLEDVGNLPLLVAGKYLAIYWGGAMVGRFIGAVAMMKVDPRKAITFNALVATALILLTTFTHGSFAMWSLLLLGLCNSIMFPTIFSLTVESVAEDHAKKIVSGYLCSAIVGGAIIPMLQGFLADQIGLHYSFGMLAICYLFIALYSSKFAKIRGA
jgi:FHS family L-fucose permease-like MFS transporter